MLNKINGFWSIFGVILVGIVIFLWGYKGGKESSDRNALLTIDSLTSSVKIIENKNKQLVIENEAYSASSEELKKITAQTFALNDRLEKHIKKVDVMVKGGISIKIPTITASYSNIDTAGRISISDSMLKPPIRFSWNDSNRLKISGIVLLSGVQIDSTSGGNADLYFRIARKKEGFLGAHHSTIIQAYSNNPYFSIDNVGALTVKNKTTAWNKWIKPSIAAIIGGVIGYKAANP